ncbi:MAG: GNAT family N-acetyltransferase [Anaerolineae bacterium]
MNIWAACPTDAPRLTAIAHAAKRHWGYSDELIALWDADLTVTPQFIDHHPVFCAVQEDKIVGFYALVRQGDTFELEHMWVDPQHTGAGIGTRLFEHAVRTVRSLGGSRLTIVSDPHAEGFYRRMGASRVGEAPSRPEGRTLPGMILVIEPSGAA